MTEKTLSTLQKEYRVFFLEKLRQYSVQSPAQLTKNQKSEFFTAIKNEWAQIKNNKKNYVPVTQVEEEHVIYIPTDGRPESLKRKTESESREKTRSIVSGSAVKQIIMSKPNEEQTDDLRIRFIPNDFFTQENDYLYPVVKMPKAGSLLKLPRVGRSNQKGYKDDAFFEEIKANITGINLSNDVHMVIPYYNKPYEPDILLFDKGLNLYIDVEIDEPYDGFYRYPTHLKPPEGIQKQDDIRDLFFNESGWVVIRFTEKQVHLQTSECIDYIKQVLRSLQNESFDKTPKCETEIQWHDNQCIQWQKINYRERYLGIDSFFKRKSLKEVIINPDEYESIENNLNRTICEKETWSTNGGFDEEHHKYNHPADKTGNAEYISVTTLIERFFPFDLKRYVERKAAKEEKSEEDVLLEYLALRDEAAEKGTVLHEQIENYLKKRPCEQDAKEFQMFLNFHQAEIVPRNLEFFDAEKIIFSNKNRIAGMIDCLFKKPHEDEYIMLDWKRSKKLIIDGRPRIFGYGYALSELKDIDNSSYYRYCLQQNIYKHILETEYSIKISSMRLVVLHENYSDYHMVPVPLMQRETNIILNSLNHKI
jgi:hypothetical protein